MKVAPSDDDYSCDFGDRTQDGSDWEQSIKGAPQVTLAYGPSPDRGVVAEFNSHSRGKQKHPPKNSLIEPPCHVSTPAHVSVKITNSLPKWASAGGWFVVRLPQNGCGYGLAVFRDEHGKTIRDPAQW